MTTVLLIDYPPAVRDALRARLSLERDLDIVGEADNASQGISLAHALDPDVGRAPQSRRLGVPGQEHRIEPEAFQLANRLRALSTAVETFLSKS